MSSSPATAPLANLKPMAELAPTEDDPPSSKQLVNVLWNRGGIEVPSHVGLGAFTNKYRGRLPQLDTMTTAPQT